MVFSSVIVDAVSTIGGLYGKIKLRFLGKTTLEGIILSLAAGIVIGVLSNFSFLISALLAAVVVTLEAVVQKTDDNLVVPLFSIGFLYLLLNYLL